MFNEELDEYAGIGLSKQEEADAALWEQRRYEIAKEMFVRYRILAIAAVNEADELIRTLRYKQHS